MMTKTTLFDLLVRELEARDVDSADEIADSIVESLDEEGAFETEYSERQED